MQTARGAGKVSHRRARACVRACVHVSEGHRQAKSLHFSGSPRRGIAASRPQTDPHTHSHPHAMSFLEADAAPLALLKNTYLLLPPQLVKRFGRLFVLPRLWEGLTFLIGS